ncbi:MAG TPA: capsule assembly Wzi family protein, partial [Sphingobacteriaceae bacterium]
MIPARGFQSVISAGVYAKYGPLSIQLRPEMVYAENRDFRLSEPDISDYYIDLPKRFGDKSYKKILPGQSSVRLSLGPVSFGLSSENLWWGPGIHNSLLMSNSAPGFNHLTLNNNKPIRTSIGSFEGQLIGGRLEGSGFTDKPDDWRYLSALTFSYQPRWVPGLFLGATRSLQVYNGELNTFVDYFPFLQSFSQKNNYDTNQPQWDQIASLFLRWVWKEALLEAYLEYGRGDFSANLRDFLLEPEHSRAYLVGFKKLIRIAELKKEYLTLNFEIINIRQPITYTIRNAGSWYTHAPIYSGYTHIGEILGTGIGPGSDLKVFQIDWVRDLNNISILIKHHKHSNDFFPPQNPNSVLTERNATTIG